MAVPICVPCQIEKGSEDPSFVQSKILNDLSCHYCGNKGSLGLRELCDCGGIIEDGKCCTCGKVEE